MLAERSCGRRGAAVHNLLESAAADPAFSFSVPRLSLEWEKAVTEAEKFLSHSSYMEGMLPLSRSIPNLGPLRWRTLLRITEGGRPTPISPLKQTGGGAKTFPGRLANKPQSVVGISDRISRTPEGVAIVDYKTGVTADVRSRFRNDYELQLKLYAGLYFLSSGEWPIRLELHGIDGSIHEVSFTNEECAELMANAESLGANLPSLTANLNRNLHAQKSLASPLKDTCRYCPYRPICPGYLSLIGIQSKLACENDLQGAFRSWKTLGNGEYLVGMEHESGPIRIRNQPPVSHLTTVLQSAVPGENMILFNVLKTEDLNPLFSPTPFTAIHSYSKSSQ